MKDEREGAMDWRASQAIILLSALVTLMGRVEEASIESSLGMLKRMAQLKPSGGD
jgi:hypothetical protein